MIFPGAENTLVEICKTSLNDHHWSWHHCIVNGQTNKYHTTSESSLIVQRWLMMMNTSQKIISLIIFHMIFQLINVGRVLVSKVADCVIQLEKRSKQTEEGMQGQLYFLLFWERESQSNRRKICRSHTRPERNVMQDSHINFWLVRITWLAF